MRIHRAATVIALGLVVAIALHAQTSPQATQQINHPATQAFSCHNRNPAGLHGRRPLGSDHQPDWQNAQIPVYLGLK